MPAAQTRERPFPVRDAYGTTELADLLIVSKRTITRMIDNGTLPAFRVPGSRYRRVTRLQLVEFLAGQPGLDFAAKRVMAREAS